MLEQVVLERALGAGLGAELGRRLDAAGIRLHAGTSVTAFTGGAHLEGVATDNAGDLPAGLAVLGVGMAPVVDLAEASGLALDGDLGGVACDGGFRTSRPGVFAAGDMAAVVSTVAGHRVRVEHWAEALNQGKMAARAMLGRAVEYDRVPYFFSDQYDLGMEYSGYAAPGGYDRVVLVYNEFKSVLEQRVIEEQLLPIPRGVVESTDVDGDGEPDELPSKALAFFEPDAHELLEELLPTYIENTIFRALLESAAAELAARRTAMRNATDNAGVLIDEFTLAMNRARQAAITQEILEVVAGADALK